MASTPTYASTPRLTAVRLTSTNVDTSRTAPVSTAVVITGVAAGTRIERVTIQADGDPADSMVTLFLYDGSTYYCFDDWDIGNPAAASTTTAGYREERAYADLVLPSASWSIRACITVAPTSGGIYVFAFGADLT